jgi:glycosyltransferase involved in cell wall biosynthesis
VAAQDHAPLEHIVIDGGSSDGTIELLTQYEKDFGVTWVSEQDGGVYSAVNKGLRLATGDILCYLNSDDLYFPYSVSTAVEHLSESGAGLVFGDLLRFDESTGRGMLLFFPPYKHRYLARGNVIAQPTVFWTREAFIKCGFLDEELALAADMDYWLRIGQRFAVSHVDEILAYEGDHGARLTAGQAAIQQANSELASIRGRYTSAGRGDRNWTWLDALRAAYHYRRQAFRFLWNSRDGSSARAWSGFILGSDFHVDRRMLFLALIPYVGRKFKWNVASTESRR